MRTTARSTLARSRSCWRISQSRPDSPRVGPAPLTAVEQGHLQLAVGATSMKRTRVTLLTVGDPNRVTGGYLYHRRLAARALDHGAELRFVSIPDLPLPWALAAGPTWLRAP